MDHCDGEVRLITGASLYHRFVRRSKRVRSLRKTTVEDCSQMSGRSRPLHSAALPHICIDYEGKLPRLFGGKSGSKHGINDPQRHPGYVNKLVDMAYHRRFRPGPRVHASDHWTGRIPVDYELGTNPWIDACLRINHSQVYQMNRRFLRDPRREDSISFIDKYILGRGGSYRVRHPYGPDLVMMSDTGKCVKHAFRTRDRHAVERWIKLVYYEAQWATCGDQIKFIRDSGPPQTHEQVQARFVLAPRHNRIGHACIECDHPLCVIYRRKLASGEISLEDSC